jgi:HD-like signal output (HDOD) protein
MSDRANALIHGIDTLITLPEVYFEIRRVIESSNSTLTDIARTIATDPALSARLLRVVNSPIYAQTRPVETITRAVSMLGMAQIHDLALAVSLASSFARVPAGLMDIPRFWRASVLRASIMRTLATRDAGGDVERSFLQGLLGDIGHLVLYLRIPESAGAALRAALDSGEPLYRVERRELGCDFAQVGAAVARAWGLPEGLRAAIAMQCEPQADMPYAREAARLHIADAMVWADTHHAGADSRIDAVVWSLCSITADDLPGILSDSHASAELLTRILDGAIARTA